MGKIIEVLLLLFRRKNKSIGASKIPHNPRLTKDDFDNYKTKYNDNKGKQ